MNRGSQKITIKGMNTLTSGLARVDELRLAGTDPRDLPKGRLETVSDMAQRLSLFTSYHH